MSSKFKSWPWAAVLLLALLAASCGAGGSMHAGLEAGTAPLGTAQPGMLPGLPLESGVSGRGVSAGEGSTTVLGSNFLLQHNGLVEGDSLRLSSIEGEGGLAYGMYRFEGLSGKKPLVLSCEAAPDPEDRFFVGVANYTDMVWQWFGPYSIPEANIHLGESSDRYVTELGNLYFLVLVEGGDAATHLQSSLSYRDADPLGDEDMPGAPFELSASDGTHGNGVAVSWAGGEGAAVFELWRRLHEAQGEAEEWSKIAVTEGREYFDESVEPGVKYRYKVRARNEHGQSAFSNTDSGFSGEGGGGEWCPRELEASDGSSEDYVELNWVAGSGEQQHYRIWRRADGTDDWDVIKETSESTYHDNTAEPGLWYIYKIQRTGEGESCFSNTDAGFRAGGQDNWCPSELWASDGTYGAGVKLEWDGGDGDGVFKVYRNTGEPFLGWDLIGTTEAQTWFDESAQLGTEYNYKVAKHLESQSCESNVDSGWRGEEGDGWCPSELGASDGTTDDGVWVEWNKGLGAGVFSLWRKVAETENEFSLVEDGISGHEFLDTTAEPEVHYVYRVRKHLESETCDSNTDVGWRAAAEGDDWCPSGLVATDGVYDNKIRLEWNPGTGEGAFKVWRKRDGGEFQWILLGTTEGSDWNDSAELDSGVFYIYKVVKHAFEEECVSNTDSGYMGENPQD